ncbi:MAG: hypothetical protein DI565_10330 [Ancylobacter novellus]|uniref:Uncharacterized protein n=1 Tax=Ancylobacter novellus TaxID=921 RepID=A0A2W5KL76_ANCNO|nr:MAG: hypothetical protein DI565_10330 [Ancylobacter novellus]
MMLRILRMAATAAAIVAAASPALAREDYCLNANGTLNKTATNGYRQFDQNRNAKLMQTIDGTWFSRTDNPLTGQVSYLWQKFEGRGVNAGLYSYFNRVCSSIQCSDYQGVGLWAVQGTKKNFSGLYIVSDLSRDHYCGLIEQSSLSKKNTVWTLRSGGKLTRVQQ